MLNTQTIRTLVSYKEAMITVFNSPFVYYAAALFLLFLIEELPGFFLVHNVTPPYREI